MLRAALNRLSYTGVCHTPERDSNPCKWLGCHATRSTDRIPQ